MSPVWLLIIFGIILIWLVSLTILFLNKRPIKTINLDHTSDESCLKRWSLVRFNPFSDPGGSHSFVICLLDTLKNGILLTSLHSRGITRFYAKKVAGGRAEQDLSDEEQQALSQAIKS